MLRMVIADDEQYVELLRRAWQAVYAKLQKRTFLPWIPHMDDSRAGVL